MNNGGFVGRAMNRVTVREVESTDGSWVSKYIREKWGADRVVSKSRMHYPGKLPGFIAYCDGKPVGLVTYNVEHGECEVVTLNSDMEGHGIGSSLLESVREVAKDDKCRRVWLITTNDNTRALRFYQKAGFRLVALYPNELEKSRALKPEIPLVGRDGIPLRDELELEILLG